MNPSLFKIVWHPAIKKDLERIPPHIVEKIITAAEHRLTQVPHIIGQPLKGTTKLLWKIRYSDYRIVYTMNAQASEVWILSVGHRSKVYMPGHLQNLISLALTLHPS